MALTTQSMQGAARRKARRAREKVLEAELHLEAANETLRRAIPRRDVKAITLAAERTVRAEDEVHEAAQELEAVDELLHDSGAARHDGAASGEGAKSLLPFLGRRGR